MAPTHGKGILKQVENDLVTVVTTFILKLKVSSNLNGVECAVHPPPKKKPPQSDNVLKNLGFVQKFRVSTYPETCLIENTG